MTLKSIKLHLVGAEFYKLYVDARLFLVPDPPWRPPFLDSKQILIKIEDEVLLMKSNYCLHCLILLQNLDYASFLFMSSSLAGNFSGFKLLIL